MSKTEFTDLVHGFIGQLHDKPEWTDAEFFDHNIPNYLSEIATDKLLDELGIKLGYPSDAESKRLANRWAIRRSWIPIVVSAIALIVSILVAIFKN